MTSTKQTTFTKDSSGKALLVKREFDAPQEKVWRAWTDRELLDKWWAPLPWKAVTQEMDFRPGGEWRYYMLGPEGEKHYCLVNYLTIDAQNNFTSRDAFCDENGKPMTDLPVMNWTNNFIETPQGTRVEVRLDFKSEEDLKTIVEMGFKEGFDMGLNQLENLLNGN